MDIQITNRNLPLKKHQSENIERRLHFALGRFASQVAGVFVTLSDINGPKGGNDTQCSLKVSLKRKGQILASDTDASVEGAIAHAADRAARSVARFLDRQNDRRKMPMSGEAHG